MNSSRNQGYFTGLNASTIQSIKRLNRGFGRYLDDTSAKYRTGALKVDYQIGMSFAPKAKA